MTPWGATADAALKKSVGLFIRSHLQGSSGKLGGQMEKRGSSANPRYYDGKGVIASLIIWLCFRCIPVNAVVHMRRQPR